MRSLNEATDDSRFARHFPASNWAIANIWYLLPAFGALATGLSELSVHYGLSTMCIWMGLLCFRVDRKHLNYCLITPLQPLAFILIFSLGAGVSMVIYGSDDKFQRGYLLMQLIGLSGFPVFIVAYLTVTRKLPGFVPPSLSIDTNRWLLQPLGVVFWVCIINELGKVVFGVVSGSIDRGDAGAFAAETTVGWWVTFNIFYRLQALAFLLLPLIWRESRPITRVIIAGVVVTIISLHFLAASRGQVVYPICLMAIGSFMFQETATFNYEILIVIGCVALFPFMNFVANYRSTDKFRETDIRDVFSKLATINDGLEQARDTIESSGQSYINVGGSLIGVADNLIYEMTPVEFPYVGFPEWKELYWVWVPRAFVPEDRLIFQDGSDIVDSYQGGHMVRTALGISFEADMYRRAGFEGIFLGLLIYGLFYGLIYHLFFSIYLYKNVILGFMLLGLFFSFLISWTFTSALTAFAQWFYEIPKYCLLFCVIYQLVKATSGRRKIPGALALREVTE